MVIMPRYHSAIDTSDHHQEDSRKSCEAIMTTTATTNNSTASAQQHSWCKDATGTASFVSVLPFELLSVIFAMLPMKQSVRCTRVCKAWRAFIFSWEGLWRELSDSTCDFAHDLAPYKSRLHGRHVKVLRINARKRRKQTQEIKFLISHDCRHVQTVHLYSTLSRQNFSRLLRLMGSNLRILDLRGHASSEPCIALTSILRHCPNLEHLTFYTAARVPVATAAEVAQPRTSDRWNFPLLHQRLASISIYMHGLTNNMPLDQLLKSLPQLRRISINPYDFRDTNAVLCALYQHGPTLEAIHYGYDSKSWTATITTTATGLRYLHLTELSGVEERNLTSLIQRNNATLEIIDFKFISKLSNETTAYLGMRPFSHLKSIILGINNDNSDDFLITEEDEEDEEIGDEGLMPIIYPTVNSNNRSSRRQQQQSALVDNLASFLHQAPQLEEIQLYNLTAANDLFFRRVATLHHLQSLTMAFCDRVSSESIILFIQQYSAAATTNQYPKRLKRLCFQGMDAINDTLMELIGSTMKNHLETLDVSECQNITDDGIRSFVDSYQGEQQQQQQQFLDDRVSFLSPTTLKELIIWSCFSISYDGYQYAQERLNSLGTSARSSSSSNDRVNIRYSLQ